MGPVGNGGRCGVHPRDGAGWKGASYADAAPARPGREQSRASSRFSRDSGFGSLCLFFPCGMGYTVSHAALEKNRDLNCCGERFLKILLRFIFRTCLLALSPDKF